jgi:hypothetical protein
MDANDGLAEGFQATRYDINIIIIQIYSFLNPIPAIMLR